jgi:hypothetical protein
MTKIKPMRGTVTMKEWLELNRLQSYQSYSTIIIETNKGDNMSAKKSFDEFIKKNEGNIEVIEVPAEWPYNYGDNIAYEVTFKNVTQYIFFNDDGKLLQQKRLQ